MIYSEEMDLHIHFYMFMKMKQRPMVRAMGLLLNKRDL